MSSLYSIGRLESLKQPVKNTPANNKMLNFEDLKIGQEADIYYNNEYYNSILTGYSIKMENGVPSGIIELKFGLVRLNLTSKLFKRLSNYGS